MSYRYHGRASVDPGHPQAQAVCDRCSFHYLLSDLRPQMQWAGTQLISLNLLVCETCLDVPQEQLRTIILPPDPAPVMNPRPENYTRANSSYIITQDGEIIATEDGDPLVTETDD